MKSTAEITNLYPHPKMQANKGSESQPSDHNPKDNSYNEVVAPPPATAAVQGKRWMTMQYPAAAMVMQHGMMAAPQYVPYHPIILASTATIHHLHSRARRAMAEDPTARTIFKNVIPILLIRALSFLAGIYKIESASPLFTSIKLIPVQVSSIKVIRNKQTGFSDGYGFVEFFTRAAAEKVLQSYSCIAMPNTVQLFRLNWATFSMGDKRSNNGSDLSIFVGDLAADVTDILLHQTFASKYPSVKAAKVVVDANTGRSKGYGFVRFEDDNERSQAMAEMNGVYCSSRPMRIGAATPRKLSGYQQQYSPGGRYSNCVSSQGSWLDGDSLNTTIFVGGLDPNVTDEDLRQPFSQYGEILSVKIPVGKGCGFVQFANSYLSCNMMNPQHFDRNNAEAALQRLSGTTIGKQIVRLSWGRSLANKQAIPHFSQEKICSLVYKLLLVFIVCCTFQLRADYGHQWSGAYYGGSFFDGYGYALPPPHSPNMYAAAYGAYSIYRTHQQQVS
ncbi:UNVERIFIED_CONTAM: Polyadenylate-binding protein RBP47C' [Sesamum angustifolium]|uniref:Polyadenylate-binding protein RBP47C n=1 Tax=Sesamum angustifolium TaxID=2727405 RepID=A0AAW2L923_9LAMI